MDIPLDAIDRLYPAVGALVVNWSIAESIIVKMTVVIYQAAGGKHEQAVIPWGYTKNKKFLRLCVNRIEALKPYAPCINELLDEANKVVSVRDGIVHGALSAFDPETAEYTFTSLGVDHRDAIHTSNDLTGTFEHILMGADRAQIVAKRGGDILSSLCARFIPE